MAEYAFFQCSFIPQKQIWEIAEDFRKKYCQDCPLPLDMEYIIEAKLGLDIEPVHGMARFAYIDAYLKSDRSAIVVDHEQYMDEANRYERRLRFSFAHEIGHFVLHAYVHERFSIETPKEYYEFIINTPEREYRAFEWQANEFAGRLLVPKDILVDEIGKMVNNLKKQNLQHVWDEAPGLVLERSAPRLCKPFGVSEEVIIRRIQEEKLILFGS